MLQLKDVYKLQSDYNVADGSFKDSEVSFMDYMAQCRIFLRNNLPEEYYRGGWDSEKKQTHLLTLASQFLDTHKVKVKGYTTAEGIVDSVLLLKDVTDAVTGESVLKEALNDPEVDEIQINDKNTIFVQKNGRLEPYIDKQGRIMQFATNDEIHIVINKLIDDGTGNKPQFTEGLPILNAKTAKHQYRIAAVHHAANTQDKPPHNFPITSVVIRKFKETKLQIEDLIKYGACTPKMGRLLMLLGLAELKLFCVGPTGSGKTTLLNIISNTIPMNKRILLVQNPSEITFQERDEFGRNVRNVVHWEVIPNAPMPDLIDETLRFTPEVVIIGEMREKFEFLQAFRMMHTGHKLNGTYHAEDEKDAINRYATELSTASDGLSFMEAVRIISGTIDIIISQYKFPDGRRRIMGLSEIQGIDENGDVKTNPIFEFELTGEVVTNEFGLPDVKGVFKQVGAISEKLANTFYKAGVPKSQLEEFMSISDNDMEDATAVVDETKHKELKVEEPTTHSGVITTESEDLETPLDTQE